MIPEFAGGAASRLGIAAGDGLAGLFRPSPLLNVFTPILTIPQMQAEMRDHRREEQTLRQVDYWAFKALSALFVGLLLYGCVRSCAK